MDIPANNSKRSLIGFSFFLLLVGVSFFFYWITYSRYHVTTSDAYVHGNTIRVTAQVTGSVEKMRVRNTMRVKEGELLLEINDTDYKIAYEESKALLAAEIRRVVSLFEDVNQLYSELEREKIDMETTFQFFSDAAEVVDSGAIPREEFIQKESNYSGAREKLKGTKYRLMSSYSKVQNSSVYTHPDTLAAIEGVRRAYVNLYRTKVYAPATGIVAEKNVQVGEFITPNAPILAIVPLGQIWVDANFKEDQLAKIKVGQRVKMTSDMYGSEVVYDGTIMGISGGSGSVFSAMPPQNATGNWIKIVQRVPVRILLEKYQLKQHPLRLGLSMHVNVDISDSQDYVQKSMLEDEAKLYKTDLFQEEQVGLGAVIEWIMKENAPYDLTVAKALSTLILYDE